MEKGLYKLLFFCVLVIISSAYSCNQIKSSEGNISSFNNLNIKFNIHTESSEMLLSWFDNQLASRIKDVSEVPGSQIMEGIVKNTLDTDQLPTFAESLKYFSEGDSLNNDSYGIKLAWNQRFESSLLLKEIRNYNFDNEIKDKIKMYIPTDIPLDINCDVYFVLTGWEWGDAMVRKVTNNDNRYFVTNNGKPVIIINLSKITQLYGDSIDDLLNDAVNNSITHELFHFVFEEYKAKSEYWKNNCDTTRIGCLMNIILNEGVAHYISNNQKKSLLENYHKSAELKKHEKEVFEKLNSAVNKFDDINVSEDEKDDLLLRANAGKYWCKYGAIAGKFMIYHIESQFGEKAIQQCLAKGTPYFIELYTKVQQKNKDLPSLPIQFIVK